jgi:hypothetical protein
MSSQFFAHTGSTSTFILKYLRRSTTRPIVKLLMVSPYRHMQVPDTNHKVPLCVTLHFYGFMYFHFRFSSNTPNLPVRQSMFSTPRRRNSRQMESFCSQLAFTGEDDTAPDNGTYIPAFNTAGSTVSLR